LYDKGYLNKEYADVKILWLSGSPPYQIQSKKPITSLSSFKGLKVRAAGQMGKAVEAMGGVAVAMPMTDVYTSLQRGVVDATVNSFDTIAIFKLNEVITSVTEFNLACLPMVYVMNKDAFAKLPADMQAFIEQTKMKYSEAIAEYTDGRAEKGLEIVKNEGKPAYRFETADLDRMPQLFAPIWADYLNQFETKGFPVKAATDDLGPYLSSKFGIKNPIVR
jgi:TRAP-type C4-dicarboxylate transport system substrate-binding protein